MKVKVEVPTAGKADVIVPDIGAVPNGGTFETTPELGAELVQSPQFSEVTETKPRNASKGGVE